MKMKLRLNESPEEIVNVEIEDTQVNSGVVDILIDFINKKLKLSRQVQWKADNSRTQQDKKANNGTIQAGNGYWYFSEPKYRSYRIIDLDDEMLALLARTIDKRKSAEQYYGSHYTRYYVNQPLNFTGEAPETPIPDNPINLSGKYEIHLLDL